MFSRAKIPPLVVHYPVVCLQCCTVSAEFTHRALPGLDAPTVGCPLSCIDPHRVPLKPLKRGRGCAPPRLHFHGASARWWLCTVASNDAGARTQTSSRKVTSLVGGSLTVLAVFRKGHFTSFFLTKKILNKNSESSFGIKKIQSF